MSGTSMLGHCGRGRVLFSHKIRERAAAAPRCAAALPAAVARSATTVTPHAGGHGTSSTQALNVKQQL